MLWEYQFVSNWLWLLLYDIDFDFDFRLLPANVWPMSGIASMIVLRSQSFLSITGAWTQHFSMVEKGQVGGSRRGGFLVSSAILCCLSALKPQLKSWPLWLFHCLTTITRFYSLPVKESPMESNGSGQSCLQRSCLAEHGINTARVCDLIPTKESLRSRYGKDSSDKSLSQMAYINSSSAKYMPSAQDIVCITFALVWFYLCFIYIYIYI